MLRDVACVIDDIFFGISCIWCQTCFFANDANSMMGRNVPSRKNGHISYIDVYG